MVEVSLTVGKLDASLALLLTKDHHLIEFPTILLPDGISSGSIVKINCERDLKKEKEEKEQFSKLQEEIFDTFGKHEPKDPILKIVNITQTSCVLEWEPLNLGTAELKCLTLYKNGSKLGPIKNPFQKKNIKFSGLPVDTPYKFQLKMETTSGIYHSNTIELKTHKMTDLSGITICIGDIDYSKEKFTLKDIEEAISSIGAKPYSTTVKVDTTQFVCTEPKGIEYEKAKNMNIPLIRPEWLKACELERRIVGVNKFYLESEDPIWQHKDFWKPINSSRHSETLPVPVPIIEEPKPEEPDEGTLEQAKPEKPSQETPEQANSGEPIEEESKQVVPEAPVGTAPEQIGGVNEEQTFELKPEESETGEQATESKKEEPATEDTKTDPNEAFTEELTAEEPTAEEPTAEEPIAEEPIAEEPIAEESKIANPVEEKKPEESVPVLLSVDDKQEPIASAIDSNIKEVDSVPEQEIKIDNLPQSSETEPVEAEVETVGKSVDTNGVIGNDEIAHVNGDKEEEEEEAEDLENRETEVDTSAELKLNSSSSNKSKNKKKIKKKGKK